RDELRPEDLVGRGIELALTSDFAPENRKALGVSVVEDLHDLGFLVGHAEVALVDHEGAAEAVEDPENRRDRGGAACEDWLVAERADRDERPALADSVVS